jgi:hypothetical protein
MVIPETELPRVKHAVLRIMKSAMRKHIYETKAKEDDNRWSPMLLVEEGFYGGAEKEWLETVAEFNLTIPEAEGELRPFLEAAVKEAKTDLTFLLEDTIPEVSEILKKLTLSCVGLNLIKLQ